MNDLDLGTYQDFAYFTASDESKKFDAFVNNLQIEQMETDVNLPLLLTASILGFLGFLIVIYSLAYTFYLIISIIYFINRFND